MKNINNKGFTLIELLVVVLLLTVITVISSDMVISMTSTSTKIQNKILLEQDYSFLDAKLTKLIKDADSVTYNSVTNELSIIYLTKTYVLKYDDLQKNILLDGLLLTDSEIGMSSPFSVSISGINPQVVTISFGLSKDFANPKLKTQSTFEKIITLNKTYQQ